MARTGIPVLSAGFAKTVHQQSARISCGRFGDAALARRRRTYAAKSYFRITGITEMRRRLSRDRAVRASYDRAGL